MTTNKRVTEYLRMIVELEELNARIEAFELTDEERLLAAEELKEMAAANFAEADMLKAKRDVMVETGQLSIGD